ncbi:MAG TPA: Na(+)/H(+) antiporter subunit D [Hyphomicrobiaceae bacterium]|nr:Na(+)/H(+) antiporter subunit D [Hyphomicrobiaceae bacterium]
MTTSFFTSPPMVLILGALVLVFTQGIARKAVLIAFPLLALVLVWQAPTGSISASYLGYALTPIRLDALAVLFGAVFALAAFLGALFALDRTSTLELSSAFVYAAGALGVVLAGDWITLFVWWEVMAIASTLVVVCGGDKAYGPAFRYALVHFLGGVLLMAGIAGELAMSGTATITSIKPESWPRWLILAGILINAGAPPLWAWVSDAYPASSWSGMVFLSVFTTKTAAYVLLRVFPGTEVLVWIGVVMGIYGVLYAALENDVRRLIAFAIVSQMGIKVAGVGIGTPLALDGVAAHSAAAVIYTALLVMVAGSVLHQTGKTRMTELGGLADAMPLTAFSCLIGVLSIAAFPLTSGFVSKSMIIDAAANQHLAGPWIALTAISVGAVLHAGLRMPWLVFFGPAKVQKASDPPQSMRIAMALAAVLCVVIGIVPDGLYVMLPHQVPYVPYSASHVLVQLQFLAFAALAFYLVRDWFRAQPSITLDLDWFYRRPGKWLARGFDDLTASAWTRLVSGINGKAAKLHDLLLTHHGPSGTFGRTWPTGTMAFWTTLLLGAFLLIAAMG